jgi:hypothetical protein
MLLNRCAAVAGTSARYVSCQTTRDNQAANTLCLHVQVTPATTAVAAAVIGSQAAAPQDASTGGKKVRGASKQLQ